jgi:aminopeptidase N
MKNSPPKAIHLKDYKKPAYSVSEVELTFDLDDTKTYVIAKTKVIKTPGSLAEPLVLHGENLNLLMVMIDGKTLGPDDYVANSQSLTIGSTPQAFDLEIITEINPTANLALDGLYKSGNIFCTQCEPEGFRKITYFMDRPDIMAKYRTRIIADKSKYPIILSNGNNIGRGDLPEGDKHWALWEDPFAKPCYLFALVAGDLGMIEDSYRTISGRVITLRIYCDKGNESKCLYAMEALKRAMKWDEDVFGLEYDLDIFMIVAVDAFNFGAMENKGLNIFNTSCLLVDEKSGTDDNFMRVEAVVAHEYFHNWTGDRVTCRDWFQLTLKEGLTVFRDQEFSSDMNSRPVKRIADVITLRSSQFPEDDGPTSHPIKPQYYIQINNFYTTTIYEKGAEVIRMIETLIGKKAFRKGIDRYFELYDGQGVTTEDFVNAMEQASGRDLKHFSLWYSQSGTPEVHVSWDYLPEKKQYHLHVKQVNRSTKDQQEKKPLLFPLKVGFIDTKGADLPITLQGSRNEGSSVVLEITKPEQTFVFDNIPCNPVASINRSFSAPVKVLAPYSREQLTFLMAHDSDSFNRWDAGQELAMQLILEGVEKGGVAEVDKGYLKAFGAILSDPKIDLFFKAQALTLPSESSVGQRQAVIDFEGIHEVRERLLKAIALHYYENLMSLYRELHQEKGFKVDPESMGRRKLKNLCLAYLMQTEKTEAIELCNQQLIGARNMTDEFGAFNLLVNYESKYREAAIKHFYKKWRQDQLVMCKWFSAQAGSKLDGALEDVKHLMKDPIFDIKIPNLVRALIDSFAQNHVQFHQSEGKGYKFLADQVLALDKRNPSLSSRLVGAFKKYDRLDPKRKAAMKVQIDRIMNAKGLSTNTYEIVSKII